MENIPLIDTHQHLWDTARFSYSWMAGLPSVQGRRLVEEYRAATKGIEIAGTVYVDTDVDNQDLAAEAAMIFALADIPANNISGVVASVRPERIGFLEHLGPFLGHPKLKGVRRVMHKLPAAVSVETQFVSQVRSLGEHELSFDLCLPARHLPQALQLVRSCADVSFVLDHCGCPLIREGKLDPWRNDIAALARQPNVTCKISGIATGTEPSDLSADIYRPYVEHVLACFGWDRVIWGGDWPMCTLSCSLMRWYELTCELFESASEEQRARLLWKNALRVYRLGATDSSLSL